jgi:ribosomal protein L16 Arg81 hydroxylase
MLSLEALLKPSCTTEEFFEQYWEKEPLLVKHDNKDFYQKLFSIWDVELACVRSDDLLLKKQGMPPEIPRPFFLAYLDGFSLIINHLDRVSPKVSLFNQALARHFIHTYTVMYMTPPHSQAVPVHSDHQDVFIMQVYGKKVWQVYKPMQPLPYGHEMVGKDGKVLTPEEIGPAVMKDVLLEQGDMLYIPRGFLHQAVTSSSASLHLTLTVPTHDFTYAKVISRAVENALSGVLSSRTTIRATALPSDTATAGSHKAQEVNSAGLNADQQSSSAATPPVAPTSAPESVSAASASESAAPGVASETAASTEAGSSAPSKELFDQLVQEALLKVDY